MNLKKETKNNKKRKNYFHSTNKSLLRERSKLVPHHLIQISPAKKSKSKKPRRLPLLLKLRDKEPPHPTQQRKVELKSKPRRVRSKNKLCQYLPMTLTNQRMRPQRRTLARR